MRHEWKGSDKCLVVSQKLEEENYEAMLATDNLPLEDKRWH